MLSKTINDKTDQVCSVVFGDIPDHFSVSLSVLRELSAHKATRTEHPHTENLMKKHKLLLVFTIKE